jgi:hypothetical protein
VKQNLKLHATATNACGDDASLPATITVGTPKRRAVGR